MELLALGAPCQVRPADRLNCFQRGLLAAWLRWDTAACRALERQEAWVPPATWLLAHPAVLAGDQKLTTVVLATLLCKTCVRGAWSLSVQTPEFPPVVPEAGLVQVCCGRAEGGSYPCLPYKLP